MDYFYDNGNFCPSTAAIEDFDPILIDEAVNVQTYDTTANHWGIEQPGHMVGLPTDLFFPNSYETVAPVTPYFTETNAHPEPTYPYTDQHLPDIPVQPQFACFSDLNAFLAGVVALEAPAPVPTPIDVPLGRWSESQGGSVISAFHSDVHPTYQPRAGSTKTEARIRWSTRYVPYGVRGTEHTNAEAGPSTLAPPYIPSAGLPTIQTPGGMPEIVADAEYNQPTAEEDETPEVKALEFRIEAQSDTYILRQWAQRRRNLWSLPSLNDALAAALEVIPTIREVVSQEPHLTTIATTENGGSEKAMKERGWRAVERALFKELTRFYPRVNFSRWSRPKLLVQVLQDLENHPDL